MSQIAVLVEFNVKPEHRAAFEAIIREHAAKTKETEPGCRRFDVLIPKKDDGRVHLVEVYADDAAFKAHGEMPRLAQVRERYKDMILDRKITLCTLD
jgi:autoinducer 2-degrading protein